MVLSVHEFTIGQNKYRSAKMDAFAQWDVTRRILPVVAAGSGILIKVFKVMVGSPDKDSAETIKLLLDQKIETILEPLTDALSKMPGEDSRFIINACLSRVTRETPGGNAWGPVMAPSGMMMFDDIDMVVMLRIVWEVVDHNLSSFYSALPGGLTSPGRAPVLN